MAIPTNNLTLTDLYQDTRPLQVPDGTSYSELLVGKMVEFEDDGIGLPTVNTGMGLQEFKKMCLVLIP